MPTQVCDLLMRVWLHVWMPKPVCDLLMRVWVQVGRHRMVARVCKAVIVVFQTWY